MQVSGGPRFCESRKDEDDRYADKPIAQMLFLVSGWSRVSRALVCRSPFLLPGFARSSARSRFVCHYGCILTQNPFHSVLLQ